MEGARPYDVGAVRHVFLLFFFLLVCAVPRFAVADLHMCSWVGNVY